MKKLLFAVVIFLVLSFAIVAYADSDVPDLYINGKKTEDMSEFLINNGTLYVSPDAASKLLGYTLSMDEYGVVCTFSGDMRIVTYDTGTGSVNVGDRRSFNYNVYENAYISLKTQNGTYVPVRMLCNSFNNNIIYDEKTHSVYITLKDYSDGLYNSNGIAIAKKSGNYGIVNASGDVILPFRYDDISNYDNPQLFEVTDNHKCGIASGNGNLVTDIIYTGIEYISAGEIYLYIDDIKGMCNIDGRIIIPVVYNDIAYSGNNIAMVKIGTKWFLLNCSTGELSGELYDEVYEITAGVQTENNMIKGYYALKNDKWGCVDSFGNTVIPFRYEALDKFDELGRARVIYNGKFGIVDCGGTVIIPPAYDYIYPFGTLKVAVAQVGDKYGAVNLNGDIAIPFEYDYIYSFNNLKTTVAYKNKEFYIINTDGTPVTSKTYKYIEEYKNGIALAYADGYGYIDYAGNEIISCVYSDVKQGTPLSVFLKKDDKWALFSTTGENLSGFIYDDADGFENGLSAVSKDIEGKTMYGYINDSGDEIIPFIYSTAQKFKYGKAVVSKSNHYGIIDVEGNTVIPFEYTGFNASYDYNVIAAADNFSKWGLISFNNKKLCEFSYDYIFEFENGYAVVLLNHKYGVIGTDGKLVADTVYKTKEDALAAINN